MEDARYGRGSGGEIDRVVLYFVVEMTYCFCRVDGEKK